MHTHIYRVWYKIDYTYTCLTSLLVVVSIPPTNVINASLVQMPSLDKRN